MSLIESGARNTVAMSALNKLRHKLQNREGVNMTSADYTLINKSIEICQSDRLTKDMIIYSFYSVGNITESSALELSDAIETAHNNLRVDNSDADFINSLKKVIDCLQLNEPITDGDKELSLKLIRYAMHTISTSESASKDLIINPITL
ncbi:MAG: hypothetical protein L7F77_06945 [Candidatus Magnetominusculus sp. LBB02]|nr:hypothetical protein [Candidatus Magnetominusculus sp. LBB02]